MKGRAEEKMPIVRHIKCGLAAACVLAASGAGPAAAILKGPEAEEAASAFVAPEAEGASIEISELAFSVAQLECFDQNELNGRPTGFVYASAGAVY